MVGEIRKRLAGFWKWQSCLFTSFPIWKHSLLFLKDQRKICAIFSSPVIEVWKPHSESQFELNTLLLSRLTFGSGLRSQKQNQSLRISAENLPGVKWINNWKGNFHCHWKPFILPHWMGWRGDVCWKNRTVQGYNWNTISQIYWGWQGRNLFWLCKTCNLLLNAALRNKTVCWHFLQAALQVNFEWNSSSKSSVFNFTFLHLN